MAQAQAQKGPPPEGRDVVRRRSYVVSSFWAVILLLGLPMWWQTTSIFRAQLPFEQMLQTQHPKLPLDIRISSKSLSPSDTKSIVQKTQQHLDDLNEFPTIHPRLQYNSNSDLETEGALFIDLVAGTDFAHGLEDSSESAPTLHVRYSSNDLHSIPQYLAKRVQDVFMEEQISAAQQHTLYSSKSSQATQFMQSAPEDVVQKVLRRDARAFKYSAEYHLTFSLFSASGSPSDWAVEEALERHVRPLVSALSKTSNFSITSQIQLYSPFSPSIQPLRHGSSAGGLIRHDDLSAFINAAEWPLSPSIGEGPTINFVLYIPSKDQIPLLIEGGKSSSWLIPQWGGIHIFNPELRTNEETGVQIIPHYLSSKSLDEPFETFSTQLLSLLGVPASDLPLKMRIESHQRVAALSLFLRASSSLGSLSRLASHLASIPIPRHVSTLVDEALKHLSASTTFFGHGQVEDAMKHASSAFRDSDKAFFDKSMVGQVYFPDEHKVAVYLPLLGPVGVPLAVALLREIRQFIGAIRG